MSNIYSVANLENPEVFDLEMAIDTSSKSLKKNLDLATQWKNIARNDRYTMSIIELGLYTMTVANYFFNPQDYPQDVNNVFTGGLALLDLGYSIGALESKKSAKRSHKEYQRRVDLIKKRIEGLKQDDLESTL